MVEMSKGKRILALLAIMSTAIAVMADLVLVPVYGLIYGAYPDSMSQVNYFISGPMLVLVTASLLTGFILKKVNKKTVMIVGGVIFAIGAILGDLNVESMYYMNFMRTLVGIGAGVTNVVAVALIADLYEDVNVRAKINGYYNAALSIVGTLFSYFGGLLAVNNPWNNVFKIYWSAIPMVILLILFIPSIKPVAETKAQENSGAKEPLGWRFWWLCLSFLLFNIIMGSTVLYYLAPYVMENNIGGPDFVGLAAGVKSIVGFLLTLVFGYVYIKLKRQTISVAYLIAALTMLVMVLYPNATVVLVIGTVCAIMYKVAMPYAYTRGSAIVPTSQISMAMSIITAVYGIGSFISTYYATWLLGIMKSETFTKTWYVNVVILGIMFIAELVAAKMEVKAEVPVEA